MKRYLHLTVLTILIVISVSLSMELPSPATKFNLSEGIETYSTTIPATEDPADIYFPKSIKINSKPLPIVLFLQGAGVDKSRYSRFAKIVASYNFAVVVPNHLNDIFASLGSLPVSFFAEQRQVNDVLSYMTAENSNPDSPLFEMLDLSKMLLLGHSYGGIVSMNSIQGTCVFPTCVDDDFIRPEELLGGVFYGSALAQGNPEQITPPLNNDGIPIVLIAGTKDGVTPLSLVEETFEQIQTEPKLLLKISGANHYSITNTNDSSDLLALDPNIPTLDQNIAVKIIARKSARFLRKICDGLYTFAML